MSVWLRFATSQGAVCWHDSVNKSWIKVLIFYTIYETFNCISCNHPMYPMHWVIRDTGKHTVVIWIRKKSPKKGGTQDKNYDELWSYGLVRFSRPLLPRLLKRRRAYDQLWRRNLIAADRDWSSGTEAMVWCHYECYWGFCTHAFNCRSKSADF